MGIAHCHAKHECAGGGEGECLSIKDHYGTHLCTACLAAFTTVTPEPGEPPRPGSDKHPFTGAPARGLQGLYRLQSGVDPSSLPYLAARMTSPKSPVIAETQEPKPGQFQIVGVWESQVQTGYGVLYIQLILGPAKQFSQQAILGGLMTYDVGTYQVGEGFIHFDVLDHEPKKYHHKNDDSDSDNDNDSDNDTEMHWLTSWTYFYTVVDENTMTFEDRTANSSWTVRRRVEK